MRIFSFSFMAFFYFTILPIHNIARAEISAPALIKLGERSWGLVAKDEKSSNSALFVGDDSALIVDPGFTPSDVEHFLAQVKKLTDRKVRWAVLTHWHPDHTMGIVCQEFPGITLVSHPVTRRLLIEHLPSLKTRFAGQLKNKSDHSIITKCPLQLPDKLVENEEVFDLGGHQIKVFATPQAHTEGDLVAYSISDNTLVTGDLFLRDSAASTAGGDLVNLVKVLDQLIALNPVKIVPGHFGISETEDLRRFNQYLKAQLSHAEKAIASGVDVEKAVATAKFPEHNHFAEFPQYEATIQHNARAAYKQLSQQPAKTGQANGYKVLKVLDAGKAPHQIEFSQSGDRAYIAAAASDKITVINSNTFTEEKSLHVDQVPLGVKEIKSNNSLIVTQFRSNTLANIDADTGKTISPALVTGGGPSLFYGPLDGGRYLVPVEKTNKMWVVKSEPFTLEKSYDVGKRPFPPAATKDGRLAFVPNFDDGSVTVIDLWNEKVVATIDVGSKPSGGVVLPGGIEYAVAVRGENTIKFINTSNFKVTGEIHEGIGDSPFSVIVAPDGKRAYVNNTASHDISVIDLSSRRVIARIPVGEIPIVIAVAPDGRTLWVACEGTHDLYIVDIPQSSENKHSPSSAPSGKTMAQQQASQKTEVLVLGMIHGNHRKSKTWGVNQVAQAIRNIKPDVVCVEIPPNRWPEIWQEWAERGEINESRVKLFPEYTDTLLPLRNELAFQIEPCAGWTREMARLRQTRIKTFKGDKNTAQQYAQYQQAEAEIEKQHQANPIVDDDPLVIHSDLYDQRTRQELQPYDQFLNDYIGPGGWTNINQAHYQLIDKTIKKHSGKRILITFGAGHKYWFLEQLRKRNDIELVDVKPYLSKQD